MKLPAILGYPASLLRQGWRFGIVGTIGFLVDAGLLLVLMSTLGLGHYMGRVISFMAAVCVTWWLNRNFTFNDTALSAKMARASILKELTTYVLFQSIGITINFGIYSLLIERYDAFYEQPTLAVAAGSLMGMIFNFVTARWIVFRYAGRQGSRSV